MMQAVGGLLEDLCKYQMPSRVGVSVCVSVCGCVGGEIFAQITTFDAVPP